MGVSVKQHACLCILGVSLASCHFSKYVLKRLAHLSESSATYLYWVCARKTAERLSEFNKQYGTFIGQDTSMQ